MQHLVKIGTMWLCFESGARKDLSCMHLHLHFVGIHFVYHAGVEEYSLHKHS